MEEFKSTHLEFKFTKFLRKKPTSLVRERGVAELSENGVTCYLKMEQGSNSGGGEVRVPVCVNGGEERFDFCYRVLQKE